MKKLFDSTYCEAVSPFPVSENCLTFVCKQTNTDTVITFKPIVVPSNRRRDGTYLVAIRVYHAGACRRIPTNLVAGPGDLTRSGRIKSAAILDRAGEIIDRMRDAVAGLTEADLAGKDVGWVVDRINCADRLHTFRLDFFDFADAFIAGLSPGARGQYVTACNTFAAFLGRRKLDINDITRGMVADFLAWMPGKVFSFANGGISPSGRTRIPGGAEARNTAKLAAIFRAAQDRYNDDDAVLIPRSPFRGMIPKAPPSHGQRPLEPELMQRVIDARHRLPTVQTALDCFVLSFALMGANLADLYEAVGKLRQGEVWDYQRRKTRTRRADGARMRLTVPEEIAGRLDALEGLLRMAGRREYATAKVNKGLARWCEEEGVERFTFYAARHTWATIARRAGVEKATVDECLVHVGDFPLTDIYAERSWELMDAANRVVLSRFTF